MTTQRASALISTILFGVYLIPGFSQAPAAQQHAQYDGPAELPRVYVATLLRDTPAPGKKIAVNASDNLQKAVADAACGDTLELAAGATFRGVIQFPAKPCDDSHWIILRTSTPDANLPGEQTRISPCFAGIASLPARPDFHCSKPANVLAKIEFDGKESGPIVFASGANHYRFIGLEITRSNDDAKLRNLAEVHDGAADHIIFDRVWMHGGAQNETKAGVHFSDMTYAAVIDSYFTDFHCIAVAGACTDAQAVNGGTGNHPGGPYKIVNSFLEASGENILFGGGPATTTPADIEIRLNYLFKPLIWKPGEPGFLPSTSGQPFIVKNLFELKNAQRVLLEGNLLENSWGGFSQAGYAILLTPKNQNNLCPLCRVTDVTVRYNRVAHVADVLQLGNGRSKAGGQATAGERYSIHDLLVDDIDGPRLKGFGLFAMLGFNGPQLREISLQHITAFPQRAVFSVGVPVNGPKIENATIANNIFAAGQEQIASPGGGPSNCSFRPGAQGPAGVLDSCFSHVHFTNNMIIGGLGAWPRGNIEVRNPDAAGILNFNNGRGGDYRLCSEAGESAHCKKASPGHRAASDGKDIGADVDAVNAFMESAREGTPVKASAR